MREACPVCSREFPVQFLQRHVNSCLDTHSPEKESPKSSPPPEKKVDAFAALGLVSGSQKSKDLKKGSATLTSILLAEKRLKRKQEELENRLRQKIEARERAAPVEEEETEAETNENLAKFDKAESAETPKPELTGLEKLESADPVEESGIDRVHSNGTDPEPVSEAATQEILPGTAPVSEFDKRKEISQLKREAGLPLAHRLRPKTLDDFYGQEKLVGHDGILRNLIASPQIPSFILWGVPGVGKTSLARIISHYTNHTFVELSGASSTAKSLKEAFAAATDRQMSGHKTILFLDEIHRFNKSVQDLLLPVVENGTVTVIGATTENPSFKLNNALLSRMHTFVMDPLPQEALVKIVNKGLLLLNKTRKLVHGLHLIAMSKDAVDYIASLSTGDSRSALNILECVNAYFSGERFKTGNNPHQSGTGVIKVSLDKLRPLLRSRNFHQMYDRVGENHYDTISAFHKSIRGSDADAAVFYLVKMLSGGEDPLFIARRMIVIASEDVGLRDSSCLPFAIAALEAIQFVGMPEAEIVLAHCTVKLARAPKSTKSYRALRKAQGLLSEDPDTLKLPIPMHLRNAPTKLLKELGYGDTYKYNPNFENGIIKQSFLPPEIQDVKFVEETHLGTTRDDAVPDKRYEEKNSELEEYRQFKKQRKEQVKQQMAAYRKKSRARNAWLSSDPVERMSSYDENLSKDDQPEYFDGSERDNYADDPECTDNFECSYDEFAAT